MLAPVLAVYSLGVSSALVVFLIEKVNDLKGGRLSALLGLVATVANPGASTALDMDSTRAKASTAFLGAGDINLWPWTKA